MTSCGSCLAQCRLRRIQLVSQLAAQLVQGAELVQHHIPAWGFVIICGNGVDDRVAGGNLYPVCTAPFALWDVPAQQEVVDVVAGMENT